MKSNKTQQQHTKPRKYNYSKKLPSFDIAIKFSFHPLSLASNSRRINSILAQDTKFLRARTCCSNYVHGFIFKFSRTKGLLHDTHTHTHSHTYIQRRKFNLAARELRGSGNVASNSSGPQLPLNRQNLWNDIIPVDHHRWKYTDEWGSQFNRTEPSLNPS